MSDATNRYKWGLDLGGTKIEGVILDQERNLEPIVRLRVPTEQQHGYKHMLGQIQKTINLMVKESGLTPSKIGMGTPGTLDPISCRMKNSNTECINGQPMLDDIIELTGLEFRFSNDANCFAVAETLLGSVQDLDQKPEVVFGVIMGTGVGGGLVIDGKVIGGRHGLGGEWGHNVLDPNGVDCYCGKVGCVEKVIAGPALERYYHEKSGTRKHLKEVAQLHAEGKDAAATETIEYMVQQFGKGISAIINTIDPDVIVLGGGVGNIPDLLKGAMDAVRPYIFNDKVETIFMKPKLGDSAGVFGAALLFE